MQSFFLFSFSIFSFFGRPLFSFWLLVLDSLHPCHTPLLLVLLVGAENRRIRRRRGGNDN